MRLSIIRHGDPDYANDDLTPSGRAEAEALASRLLSEEISHCAASPLGRAQATAAPFLAASGLELETLPWCREWGGLECSAHQRILWDLEPDLLLGTAEPGCLCDDGGSTLKQQQGAMISGSEELLARHGCRRREGGGYTVSAVNENHLAVFCHCGFGLAWLAYLLHVPLATLWATFWLPPSSVTTILFESHRDGVAWPRVCRLGDTSHLLAAGLPVSTMGLRFNQR